MDIDTGDYHPFWSDRNFLYPTLCVYSFPYTQIWSYKIGLKHDVSKE